MIQYPSPFSTDQCVKLLVDRQTMSIEYILLVYMDKKKVDRLVYKYLGYFLKSL